MPYTPTQSEPAEFGDGSDGNLHLQGNAHIAKPEYNFASLTIDAGVVWSKLGWDSDLLPITIIRCQTAIVLNGKITANGVSATLVGGGSGFLDPCNQTASGYGEGPMTTWAEAGGKPSALIFPVVGGGANPNTGPPAFPTSASGGDLVLGYEYGEIYDPYDIGGLVPSLSDLVGPGRPYRYCAGGGGSAGDVNSDGGNGGGIVVIYAPGIIFGTGGAIEAKGTDGGGTDAGGGGGGYVEVHTRTALTAADKAKVNVAGGWCAGEPVESGFPGMSGLKRFLTI
jgi:hypothetical protein